MRRELTMACFDRASPALKEILLNAEKHVEIDYHLYEFGSVEYHIQSPAADPNHNYLSISTPMLSQGVHQSYGFSRYTTQMIKEACSDAVEIVEPPREGYQLTLKLDFSKIPNEKDSKKVITQISSVPAVILSSQLKEMLENVNSQDMSQGMYKPNQTCLPPKRTLLCHQTAPPCTWSPIPPPELRGEPLEDLSTNGGFVSFDISSRHVEGKKIDKTAWGLLNFYSYVKNHIKCTRGFTQRRMQKHLESLVEVLHKENQEEDENAKKVKEIAGRKYVRKLLRFPRSAMLKQRCGEFTKKIKGIRFRIKIQGFGHFRRRWLTIPKFSSPMRYTKPD
ncbi:hypothetical protein P3X46_006330 [Hevea brasiliensis]|uniref:Arp2/3 complex 34 kDa subunit n=1 Tax=Hevea brasiliensis TaxID=3981 RepID=A0ABQ9MPW0_HEVBR|nr:hypothetical protein P3X46_006330 [Hevea brasiliensis]